MRAFVWILAGVLCVSLGAAALVFSTGDSVSSGEKITLSTSKAPGGFSILAVPTHDTPVLNASDHPTNSSSANLTAYSQNGNDSDGDNISWVFDWRLDNVSLALLYFPFDINDSSLVESFSSLDINGSLGAVSGNTAPTWQEGGVADGHYFFDSAQDITINDSASLLRDNITISFLIRSLENGGSLLPIVAWEDDDSGININRFQDDLYLDINAETDYNDAPGFFASTAVFYHTTVVLDDGIVRFYQDGVLFNDSHSYNSSLVSSVNDSIIGYTGSGGSQDMYFDEFRVFNRTLSADQIYQLYLEDTSSGNNSVLLSNETSVGDNWSVSVTPSDGVDYGETKISNSVLINANPNSAPTHDTPVLNASDHPVNSSSANLTAYPQNGNDSDGDNISWVFDWRLDGSSISFVNVPFLVNVSANGTIIDFSSFNRSFDIPDSASMPSFSSSEGISGGSLFFEGATDADYISQSATYSGVEVSHSFSLWVKPTNYSQHANRKDVFTDRASVYTTTQMYFDASSDNLTLVSRCAGGGQDYHDLGFLPLSSWYHVVYTVDVINDVIAGYIDGQQVFSESCATHDFLSNTETIYLGTFLGDNYGFTGYLDEYVRFNYSLDVSDVATLYESYNSSLYQQILPSGATSRGDNWSVSVTPSDGTDYGATKLSNSLTVLNSVPTHDTPILNASDHPVNSSSANLTAYSVNGIDVDGDNISWVFDWLLDGSSLAVLNLPFDANVSSNVSGAILDFSLYGNNATLGGGTSSYVPVYEYVNSSLGGVYAFDGDDDYLEVPTSSELQGLLNTGVTISLWLKPELSNNGSTNVILENCDCTLAGAGSAGFAVGFQAAGLGIALSRSGADLYYNLYDTDYGNSGFTFGEWNHLLFTLDKGPTGYFDEMFVLVNGVSLTIGGAGTPNGLMDVSSRNFSLGGRGTSNSFNGSISNVLILNRTVSLAQGLSLFEQGQSNIDSSTITRGDNWSVALTPSDGTEYGTTKVSNSLTVLNSAPTHDTPILNASDNPTNSSSANLTAYSVNGVDVDGDPIKYLFDWRLNNASIALINTPFENATQGADLSTNSNNAIVVGATLSTGAIDGWSSYNFDGVDDYINFTHIPDTLLSQWTIAFWLKANDLTQDQGLVTIGGGGPGTPLIIWRDESGSAHSRTDMLAVYLDNDTAEARFESASGSLNNNSWNHFVISFLGSSSNGLRVYINGIEDNFSNVSTIGFPNIISGGTEDLIVGSSKNRINFGVNGAPFLNGSLDNFMWFNRTLSPQQAKLLYLEQSINSTSSTLFFNETSIGDNWSVAVTPSDGSDYGTTKVSNSLTVLNSAPTHDTPILNASDHPLNTTSANLTAYPQNGVDVDGDTVFYMYDWRLNGSSIAPLAISFDVNQSLQNFGSDEINITAAYDEAARTPTWVDNGDNGFAALFDGEDDFLNVTGNLSGLAGDNITITSWVKLSGLTGASQLVYLDSGSSSLGFYPSGQIFSNIQTVDSGGQSTFALGPVVNLSQWYHLAVRFNGTHHQLFIDGVSYDTETQNSTDRDAPGNTYVGGQPAGGFINGTIDQLKIYARSLSDEQIELLALNQTNILLNYDTVTDDNWSVSVTPSDSDAYGISKTSNSLVVLSDTKANGESCSIDGECTSSYCADSFYNGSVQPSLCCASSSCVASGACYADAASVGGSTCYSGVWIANSNRFEVKNSSGSIHFVSDKFGSAASSQSWLLDGVTCDIGAAASAGNSFIIQNATSPVFTLSSNGSVCSVDSFVVERSVSACSGGGCFDLKNSSGSVSFRVQPNGSVNLLGDFVADVSVS